MERIRFILRGKSFEISRSDVENMMLDIEPEDYRDHFVWVHGKKYPPKQIISHVTKLERIEFTTMDAVRILYKLGFSKENANVTSIRPVQEKAEIGYTLRRLCLGLIDLFSSWKKGKVSKTDFVKRAKEVVTELNQIIMDFSKS